MKTVKCCEKYIDQLTDIFDEYRLFCGFELNPLETSKFLKKLMLNEESVIFIALDAKNENVMGFVNLYPCYSSLALQRLWILNDLGVSSKHRGKGVSKALIQQVQKFAKETKAVRIELKTGINNTTAQRLYQSMDFTIDNNNVYYRVPC